MLFRTIANSDSFVCIVLSSGRGSGDVAQQAALGSHINFNLIIIVEKLWSVP